MTLDEHAEKIAAKVGGAVQIAPLLLLEIALAVIQMGIQCWQKSHTFAPDTAQRDLINWHRRSPRQVRRMFADRIYATIDKPMSREDADALADAALAYALDEKNGEEFERLMQSSNP